MQVWVRYILIAFFIVLFFGGAPLYVYVYMLFLTVLFAQLWVQLALLKLRVKRRAIDKGYFVGEVVPVVLELENPSLLPVLWAYAEESVPSGLLGREQRILFSLPIKKRQVLKYTFQTNQRGVYSFSPVKVISADVLGLFHYSKVTDTAQEITVYPRYRKLVFEGRGFVGPHAYVKAKMSLTTDPLVVVGSRDYQRGDPLNTIDWKATARTMELKTRQSEYRKALTTTVLFNANLDDYKNQVKLEEAIETVASLVKWLIDNKGEVAFFSNGRNVKHLDDRGLPVLGVTAKSDKEQFLRILNSLALIKNTRTYPYFRLFDRVLKEITFGSSLIFVTPVVDDELWLRLAQTKKAGKQVWIVLTERLVKAEQKEYLRKSQSLGIPIFVAVPIKEDGTVEVRTL
ncbi:MAG: DUF58 domain-containing protein [Bacillota bacterium]|jgi:uncharacterized protein (DUF58 family)|nr:DUF58 domain-containing protein [Bacillota bacterium]NLU55349.1 DUF58 domain-containing protein [Bacillota bacterium]HOA90568.1 DUF58 domain-containing protein [Bacillota bacterium]HOP54029.1 DUF58 domain-containing protein [Bacillota bacterium]HPT60450.1 DUF58 domain-containing protein [Bacillota bacterium]